MPLPDGCPPACAAQIDGCYGPGRLSQTNLQRAAGLLIDDLAAARHEAGESPNAADRSAVLAYVTDETGREAPIHGTSMW